MRAHRGRKCFPSRDSAIVMTDARSRKRNLDQRGSHSPAAAAAPTAEQLLTLPRMLI